MLPVGAPEYTEGYGLDRLRELVLTDLTSEAAEQGTHLYESLGVLFRLVNDGYPPETLDVEGASRRWGRAAVRGAARRPVLAASHGSDRRGRAGQRLPPGRARQAAALARSSASRDRGFVSYAQLGINQLGAVYEGLMSYTGSIADDEMVEVAKDGDPAKGSWVVPVAATEGFDERWFVDRRRPRRPVRSAASTYAPGDFVFRLSGRDRQRSASYYTPEVLTRCVVTHSLAELLTDEDAPPPTMLELTVCEPALGSGAFLVEAINQLAGEYLTPAQEELRQA